MSERRKISQLDSILRKIGIEGRTRDSFIMKKLSIALRHPSQICDSEYLSDDDPLKITARNVLEDFEALTNGMRRPDSEKSPVIIDSSNPLYPWFLLTKAVAAFYKGDLKTIEKTVREFPEDSAVATLKEIFEILGGKPSFSSKNKLFTEKIRMKNRELSEGLEILDEAASYPDLLRKEIGYYIQEMARENTEAAKRLYYWAMEIISEEVPLTDADELNTIVPGAGEASRLCALASIRYDPDRALLAWLRSFHSILEEGSAGPEELTARLKITGELMQIVKQEELLTGEILSSIRDYLNSSYPLIRNLMPSLPPPPDETEKLSQWLTQARSETSAAGKKKKRKKRTIEVSGLLLFEEVS